MEKYVNLEGFPPFATFAPNATSWAPYGPGYGPGVLIGRKVDYQPEGCPPPDPGGFYPPAYSLTRLTFIAPDGTEYQLRDQVLDGKPVYRASCLSQPVISRGNVFRTADGSAMTFISDNEITDVTYGAMLHLDPTGYLLMRDGTRYRIEGGKVTWIRDRNGNRLTFT